MKQGIKNGILYLQDRQVNIDDKVYIGEEEYNIIEINNNIIVLYVDENDGLFYLTVRQFLNLARWEAYEVPDDRKHYELEDVKVGEKVWHVFTGLVEVVDINQSQAMIRDDFKYKRKVYGIDGFDGDTGEKILYRDFESHKNAMLDLWKADNLGAK